MSPRPLLPFLRMLAIRAGVDPEVARWLTYAALVRVVRRRVQQ